MKKIKLCFLILQVFMIFEVPAIEYQTAGFIKAPPPVGGHTAGKQDLENEYDLGYQADVACYLGDRMGAIFGIGLSQYTLEYTQNSTATRTAAEYESSYLQKYFRGGYWIDVGNEVRLELSAHIGHGDFKFKQKNSTEIEIGDRTSYGGQFRAAKSFDKWQLIGGVDINKVDVPDVNLNGTMFTSSEYNPSFNFLIGVGYRF